MEDRDFDKRFWLTASAFIMLSICYSLNEIEDFIQSIIQLL